MTHQTVCRICSEPFEAPSADELHERYEAHYRAKHMSALERGEAPVQQMYETIVVGEIKILVSTTTGPAHSRYSECPQAWQELVNALREAKRQADRWLPMGTTEPRG